MALRSFRERVLQTLLFELGGIILVTPLYGFVFDQDAATSLTLIAVLSAAVMIWSPLHNAAFDWADLRITGRLASDRPHGLRTVHAVSHEVSVIAVTLPVLIYLGDHGLRQALALNLALTIAYTAYAYVFHLTYDRLRPVARTGSV